MGSLRRHPRRLPQSRLELLVAREDLALELNWSRLKDAPFEHVRAGLGELARVHRPRLGVQGPYTAAHVDEELVELTLALRVDEELVELTLALRVRASLVLGVVPGTLVHGHRPGQALRQELGLRIPRREPKHTAQRLVVRDAAVRSLGGLRGLRLGAAPRLLTHRSKLGKEATRAARLTRALPRALRLLALGQGAVRGGVPREHTGEVGDPEEAVEVHEDECGVTHLCTILRTGG